MIVIVAMLLHIILIPHNLLGF